MLAVKKKEITELREDCQRRDAALDDITAAARATRAASDEVTTNLPLIPLILKNIVVVVVVSRSRYRRAFDEFHPSFTMCECGGLLEAENWSFGGSLQTKRLCNI